MARLKKPAKLSLFPSRTTLPSQDGWWEIIQESFRRYRKLVRSRQDRMGSPETMDLTDAMVKRRCKAVWNSIPGLYDCVRVPEQDVVLPGQAWLELNQIPQTYTQLDKGCQILLGAAIWILDQLVPGDQWTQALECLPRDEALMEDLDIPELWDARYDSDLLLSVVYVLASRNPLEEDGCGRRRTLTSDWRAKGKRSGGPDWENYRRLMDLIPEQARQQAVKRFREQLWAWTRGYYQALEPLLEDTVEAQEALRQAQRDYNRLLEEFWTAAKGEENRPKKPAAPMASVPKADPLGLTRRTPGRGSDLLGRLPEAGGDGLGGLPEVGGDPAMGQFLYKKTQLDRAIQGVEQAVEAGKEIEDRRLAFALRATSTLRERGKVPEDGTLPQMPPLEISDPYELCFALLYLIEADDDLPWLYGPGCGLMVQVLQALPWGVGQYHELADKVWVGYQPMKQEAKPIPVPALYERRYRRAENTPPRSLAQIIYEATGCVLPRDLTLYSHMAAPLSRYGIRGKEAEQLMLLMAALSSREHQVPAVNLEDNPLLSWAFLGGDEEDEEEPEDAVDVDALKAEVRQLKAALHDTERECQRAQEALAAAETQGEQDRRELADLREYVFRQEEGPGEAEEDTPLDGSQWPYQVRRDTVIFGGHATWSKGIRSILTGNVRFVDKDMLFDTRLVKRAEVLWIQPNALSHPMYWRIVDTARTCRKPVRYFTFASWAKCAQQVRTEDAKG